MNDVAESDVRQQQSYQYWTDEIVRFADLDRLNHINNVAFATYCESGRVDFLEALWPGCTAGSGIGWVIAEFRLKYLAAGYYPNKVRIGSRVQRVGNSSVVLEQGLFIEGGCIATAESVLVWADTQNEKSLPMDDALKVKLRAFS
ncbi:MAG: thioesterase family protein [Halopseudomonas sp.]